MREYLKKATPRAPESDEAAFRLSPGEIERGGVAVSPEDRGHVGPQQATADLRERRDGSRPGPARPTH